MMQTGTSGRDIVRAALDHKETPSLPIDLGSTRASGINGLAYDALRKSLGAAEQPVRVFDVRQYLALVDDDIASWAHVDTAPLYPLAPSAGVAVDTWKQAVMPRGLQCLVPGGFDPVRREDGTAEICDASGVARYRRPPDGLYFDDVNPRFAEVHDSSHFDRLAAQPLSAKETKWLSAEARRLEQTGRAVVATTPLSVFERGIRDFGYEEWLVRIMIEPELVESYLAWLERTYIAVIDAYAECAGSVIDVFLVNDDLGMQQGPLIPPVTYRSVFAPVHRRLNAHIHTMLPESKVLLHSCGSVRQLIPDFIEAGFDALNPVQISAAGMDPASLKREFGEAITFWGGGVDTQNTLSHGSPQEVRSEVRRLIETFAPGGGFVFASSLYFNATATTENIVALFETAAEYRGGGS